jgi:dTMP kinase
MPKLILFEGPEGAGKTSIAKRLAKQFANAGTDVTYLREPGGDAVGEAIRGVLLNPAFKGLMEPMAEFFLFQASRAQFVRRMVQPLLKAGKTVILDRYSLSTMAYQVAARGLPLAQCLTAIEIATGGLIPDVTFLLTCSFETGRERQAAAGKKPDRLEAEDPSFHHAVLRGYQDFARVLPDWNIKTIDTDPLSENRVFEQVLEALRVDEGIVC